MVKKEPAQSKYRLLADAIRNEILSGNYKPGDKLSSENEMSEKFAYSRQTVRQALAILEQEGIVRRQKGSGTYVTIPSKKESATKNIGVITTYITDYIFPHIIRGIEEELSRKGYRLTLGVTKNRVEEEGKLLRSFLNHKVDGLIVEGTKTAFPNPNIGLYRRLQQMGIPIVFINGYYRELPCVYVATNDRACGIRAAEFLLKRGSHLGGIFKSDDLQGHERYAGFTQGIIEGGAEINDSSMIWYTTESRANLFKGESATQIYDQLKKCDGVLCYNDQIAYDLIEFLTQKGVRVPDDVAVLSYDNSSISQYCPIKISSFNHPKDQLGIRAADKIIGMIELGIQEKPLLMDMELVVKESAKI